MAKLPVNVSGRELRTALERIGFVFRRQKGSHMILRREDPYARVTIPDHGTIRPGTLRQIMHDAQLDLDDLLSILDR